MIRPIDVVTYIGWFSLSSLLMIDTFTSMIVNYHTSTPNTTAAGAVLVVAILAWLLTVLTMLLFGINIEKHPKIHARIMLFILNRLEYRIVHIDWIDTDNKPVKQIALETRYRFPVTWGTWKQTNIYHREYNQEYIKTLKGDREEQRSNEINQYKDVLVRRKREVI